MKIPKEIQDLMPEKFNHPKGSCTNCNCRVYDQALSEVEAVLPKIIALAEKRGAENARKDEAYLWFDAWYEKTISPAKGMFGNWACERLQEINCEVPREDIIEELTQPNHER
jgi:hypothetical protein